MRRNKPDLGRNSKRKMAKKAAKKSTFDRSKMKKAIPYLEVKNAEYVNDNILLITFSDGRQKQVDFSLFFQKNSIPFLDKYKQPSNFKKFKIEDGNVVWGDNWDLIFPIEQLYKGVIK